MTDAQNPNSDRRADLNRRTFINATGVAGAAALGGALAPSHLAADDAAAKPLKILGISCSPRKGMTTARAVLTALEAAKAADPRIAIELIDLGGLNIGGHSPKPLQDDFNELLPKLSDPSVAALVIGSPSYFRGMSSLCKAFIERCLPLRDPVNVFADKPVGVVAVGGTRHGGHEMVVQQIQAAMLCYGMILVGGGPSAPLGGTLLSAQDSIESDAAGLDSARNVGRRVAAAVLRGQP